MFRSACGAPQSLGVARPSVQMHQTLIRVVRFSPAFLPGVIHGSAHPPCGVARPSCGLTSASVFPFQTSRLITDTFPGCDTPRLRGRLRHQGDARPHGAQIQIKQRVGYRVCTLDPVGSVCWLCPRHRRGGSYGGWLRTAPKPANPHAPRLSISISRCFIWVLVLVLLAFVFHLPVCMGKRARPWAAPTACARRYIRFLYILGSARGSAPAHSWPCAAARSG